jgi:hypothetical protein
MRRSIGIRCLLRDRQTLVMHLLKNLGYGGIVPPRFLYGMP